MASQYTVAVATAMPAATMMSRQLSLSPSQVTTPPPPPFAVFASSSDLGRTGQDHCYFEPDRQAAISPDPPQFVTVGAILAVPPITDQGGLIQGERDFLNDP